MLAFLAAVSSPAVAQSTFHGNVARTGVYAGAGPVQAPSLKWTFKAAGPIVTSPAVAGGVVYIASLSGHLYALDQATGQEKWNFKSSRPIASSPTVDEGTVYFVSSAGSLAAIDAATGQPKWVYAIEHERRFEAQGLHGYPYPKQTIPDAWDVFTSSPAVAHGKVYFGSGDGNVYAIDAKSGVLQWKFATGDVVHASPAVAGNTVYIGSWDGRLYAIDAESGQQKWAFEAGQDPTYHNQVGFQSSPAVVDGTVYVGCRDAHVYALDAATGRKKWDYPTSKSWVNGTPASKLPAGVRPRPGGHDSRAVLRDAGRTLLLEDLADLRLGGHEEPRLRAVPPGEPLALVADDLPPFSMSSTRSPKYQTLPLPSWAK